MFIMRSGLLAALYERVPAVLSSTYTWVCVLLFLCESILQGCCINKYLNITTTTTTTSVCFIISIEYSYVTNAAVLLS